MEEEILSKNKTLFVNPHSFNDAVKLAGNGKFQLYLLFTCGLGTSVFMYETYSLAFAIPSAKCELKLTTSQQGISYVMVTFGIAIASFFWGFLADTWGRQKVLKICLIMCFVASAISSMSIANWMLLITRFFVGLCLAGIHGTSFTYLGEFHTNKNRPRYMAFLASFLSLTMILLPSIGLLFLTRSFEIKISWFTIRPWRVFMFCGSSLSLICLLCVSQFPESPKFLLATGRNIEALAVLQQIYTVNKGKPKKSYEVLELLPLNESGTNLSEVVGIKGFLSLVQRQIKPLFLPPYLNTMLLLFCSLISLYCVSYAATSWFPQILTLYTDSRNLSISLCEAISLGHNSSSNSQITTIGSTVDRCNWVIDPSTFTVTIIMGCTLFTLNLLNGFMMRKFSPKLMLSSWLTFNTIAAFCLMWSKNYYLNATLIIIITSTSACSTNICAIVSDLFPTHLKVMSLSLMITFTRLGGIIGSNITAAMIYGLCSTLYGLNFILLSSATIVLYFILRKCELAKQRSQF